MYLCPDCNYQNDNLNSLRIHASKTHKISSEDLYLKVVHKGDQPTCKCGCNKKTKFISLSKGYTSYVRGHASRVNNNWGHNLEAREKSLKKRRDEGLWSKVPWNKGKTKENDERLAKLGRTMSQKHGERYSKIMSENRTSGVVPSLTGSDHPRWQGGASRLSALARSHIYSVWTFPKLKADGFTCQHCGSKSDLAVHHDEIRFAQIMDAVREELGDPGERFDLKTQFAARVAEFHEQHQVSGITLCAPCHRLEHDRCD